MVKAFIILFVMFVSFIVADNVGIDNLQVQGTVVDKSYRAAYTTNNMVLIGKVWVPQTQHHPERWSVNVAYSGKSASMSVTENDYNVLSKGSEVPIEVYTTRYTDKLTIDRIGWE